MINQYPTKEYFESQKGIPIIDIRTQGEWYETGILKGSHTVTFFDEMGQYDIDGFLESVLEIIGDKKNRFLLICRTGSRTGQISQYLAQQGFNTINLMGGIYQVQRENSYQIVPFLG